ncbi:cytochrome c [uncultured Jannaschia sp.]|uniref:c-type cytochrome n=1 Tax=uncultured Jannaschia sp. TaxID=293347 RepID=UPI002603AFB4|nr:cytochrome c [uncultured Jannaschia sp.]
MTKKFGAGLALGIIGTILVAIAIWLTLAYTGAYNVAASAQHADPVRWTFDTTMRRSVASRAGGVELPATVSEDVLAEGAGHYAESCAHCHGTPGGEPAEWSRGMRPEPPHLVEAATEWTPEEIYWIVENGIKMSGMPAFGGHHSSEEMVALTGFVSALPGLTADDYATLTGSADGSAEQTPSPATGEPNGEPQPETPVE